MEQVSYFLLAILILGYILAWTAGPGYGYVAGVVITCTVIIIGTILKEKNR